MPLVDKKEPPPCHASSGGTGGGGAGAGAGAGGVKEGEGGRGAGGGAGPDFGEKIVAGSNGFRYADVC
jgi:hypothetical protein